MALPDKAPRFTVKKITLYAVLLAVSLILSYVESLFFNSVSLPGIKLGLSNISLLAVVYLSDPIIAFIFGILKCVVSLLFTGRLSSLLFSMAGVLFATCAMVILSKIKFFSVFGVSACGSVFHVWGQLFAASMYFGTLSFLAYMPLLTVLAIVNGLLTALPVLALFKSSAFTSLWEG